MLPRFRILVLACCCAVCTLGNQACLRKNEAYATLLTTSEFVPGAVVLARILSSFDTTRPVLSIVLDSLLSGPGGQHLRRVLEAEGIQVIPVPRVGRPTGPGALMYPQYATTYTKLHLFNLTGYSTLVYLDADTMPLAPIQDLFMRNVTSIAAAPDIMLPDSFNSGVMVIRPSQELATRIFRYAATAEPYDGGDQGLLNGFFNGQSEWYEASASHRLPISYNLPIVISKLHPVSWSRALRKAKVLHFSGGENRRPWRIQGSLPSSVAAAVAVWNAVWAEEEEDEGGRGGGSEKRGARGGARAAEEGEGGGEEEREGEREREREREEERRERVRKLLMLPCRDEAQLERVGAVEFERRVHRTAAMARVPG